MAKFCFSCGKVLSDNQTLTYQNQPICEECLSKLTNIENTFRKEKDWFIEVIMDDTKDYYDKGQITTEFKKNILAGKYSKNSKIITNYKDKDKKWQKTESTLEEFAQNHFQLNLLYQPIWAHAMAGLKWGTIFGIFLKLADTFFLILSVDPGTAFLFAIAVAVVAIPRIGWMVTAGIAYAISENTQMNVFIVGLAAALAGAILGCFPGMAIGGIIGLFRKGSLPRAMDAKPESNGIVFKAIILPLILGASIFYIYFFIVNPWLVRVLQ